MFYFHPNPSQLPVGLLLSGRELPSGWLFFRLAGFLHRRLIPLEPGILVQDGARRIGNLFVISNLLVVRLAGAGFAQVVDPGPPRMDDDHVLVTMLLLPPAVVEGLLFRVFRPLAASLRRVDD